MVVQRIEEFKITKLIHEKIAILLSKSFSGFPEGRSFYKQAPDFRYLVWEDNALIAHMAVINRVMNNNGLAVKVFGISDLCVEEDYQHKKLATHLIKQLTRLGIDHSIDFIVLLAKDHQLYISTGFRITENDCQWLMIENNRSLGVIHRKIRQTLMIKELGEKQWEEGLVDFLGHIF